MSKRPEFLLLAVGLVALVIAGILTCTHQPVPSWDVTVIVATLVGGGVATTPQTARLSDTLDNVGAVLADVVHGHVTLTEVVSELRAAIVAPPAADPVTSVTTLPTATPEAAPTAAPPGV